MADLKVYYNGEKIAKTSSSGKKILKTAGMICESDITVEYQKPTSEPMSNYTAISHKGGVIGGITIGSYVACVDSPYSAFVEIEEGYRRIYQEGPYASYEPCEDSGESEFTSILVCTGTGEGGPTVASYLTCVNSPESYFVEVEYDPS